MGAELNRWTLSALFGRGGGNVAPGADAPAESIPDPAERLELDFPAAIARAFPEAFSLAWPATEKVLAALDGADLSRLARRSPALAGYDWRGYLRCSAIRMVRALDGLWNAGVRQGRVLDFGAYFGNVSLMCAAAGFEVDALDAFVDYRPAFDRFTAMMAAAGITVKDFGDVGPGCEMMPAASYDAIVCLGVVEHIPHTPRPLLESLNRLLKPGGTLVLDTPNIAYLYNRQRLARGDSIMAPLATQYYTELPFEGHHREYTAAEVRWMLEQIQHQVAIVDTYNYSLYALGALSGDDLANYRQMEADPSLREIIISISRKPGPGAAA